MSRISLTPKNNIEVCSNPDGVEEVTVGYDRVTDVFFLQVIGDDGVGIDDIYLADYEVFASHPNAAELVLGHALAWTELYTSDECDKILALLKKRDMDTVCTVRAAGDNRDSFFVGSQWVKSSR